MPGLLSAMEGFCVHRHRHRDRLCGRAHAHRRADRADGAQQVQLLRVEPVPDVRHPVQGEDLRDLPLLIVVAFFSAVLVGVVFLILNRLFFHMKAADATIGALNSLYLNSNNIGLPIATYILGNPALVAPILVMQQAVFTPIGLTVLDVTTKGKVSAKEILKQPLHQPLLIGSLLGIAVSAISAKVGFFVIPSCIYDPINMIGNSAVPMILMAFGMSLHGTKPLQDKSNIPAVFTVAVLKNIVMPIIVVPAVVFRDGLPWRHAVRMRGARCPADRAERLQLRGAVQRGSVVRTRRHSFLDAVIADFHRNHRGAPRLTSPVLAAVSTTAAARPSIVHTVAGITEPVRRMIRGTPSEHHQRITQADSRGQRKQRSRIEQRRCQNRKQQQHRAPQ